MSRAISDRPAPTHPARGSEILQGVCQSYLRGLQDVIYTGAQLVWRQTHLTHLPADNPIQVIVSGEVQGTPGFLRFSIAGAAVAITGELRVYTPAGALVEAVAFAIPSTTHIVDTTMLTRQHPRYRVEVDVDQDATLGVIRLEWVRDHITHATGDLAYSTTETAGNSPLTAAAMRQHADRATALYYAERQLYCVAGPHNGPRVFYCPCARLGWRRTIYVRAQAMDGPPTVSLIEYGGAQALASWTDTGFAGINISPDLEWFYLDADDAESIVVRSLCILGVPSAAPPWCDSLEIGGKPATIDLPRVREIPALTSSFHHHDYAPVTPSVSVNTRVMLPQGVRTTTGPVWLFAVFWGRGTAPRVDSVTLTTPSGDPDYELWADVTEYTQIDNYWLIRCIIANGPAYADRHWGMRTLGLTVVAGYEFSTPTRTLIAAGVEAYR